MISTKVNIQEVIADIFPFQYLPKPVLESLATNAEFLRYHMGQAIIPREVMPIHVTIIYQGQARSLGYDPRSDKPTTLRILKTGEVVGWISLLRGVACETVIASTEVVGISLPVSDFLYLIKHQRAFAQSLQSKVTLIEIYQLLGEELNRRADGSTDLAQLTNTVWETVEILNLPLLEVSKNSLDGQKLWLVSNDFSADLPVGSVLEPENNLSSKKLSFKQLDFKKLDSKKLSFKKLDLKKIHSNSNEKLRLLGIPKSLLPTPTLSETAIKSEIVNDWIADIPYAPEIDSQKATRKSKQLKHQKFPYIRGKGGLSGTLACLQMLGQYYNLPFRKDMLQRILTNQIDKAGSLSLPFCGAVIELMGLTTQTVEIPASAIGKLQPPVMISWQESFAVVYKSTDKEILLAVPEIGLVRRKIKDFQETWGMQGEVLLMQPTKNTPQKRFSLNWFTPSLKRYRKVLIEVLIASVVVQLFGLVNPLTTQVIIDKVIVGNSPDTLEVLGIFLIVIAVVEAILTTIRTHLFVDTTNRIDLSLGSEVINHLLRLPLSYFDRRPIGELTTRVGELENIRSFLTGTALTVAMDAVFSVIYILVMAIYSWMLTLVALVTVPLFAILNWLVSPIIRRQLQTKAERNAETHSYLVEVLSGMQTVKAQNLELRSRWKWQERYARYVSAGFQTVSTQTTATSISNFLSKLSTLLVLWVGAYLVLQGELSLGQLIAFRIISGYVTSPLLRLLQLWQNFQQVSLSLQRLSDILDTPQEVEAEDRDNILMPSIQGRVEFDNLSFSFQENAPLQLCNINLDFQSGSFVGVVGQSGSGKSTLLKLLPRLYDPKIGKILIDGYDISKVELYSLRRQIGVVLQDTLLFDGTIKDNIALAYPDASDDEIIVAAKIAYAHDFIMNLPNGYNTQVGERGSSLSGGQRQRIAIARTVLQNPQLLILDEATSALDYNAEAEVCRNIAQKFQDKTVFFITHRLTTIRNADVILMMDAGTVIEQGTHDELMALKGSYYCLYQQQEAHIQPISSD
ncbi:MAG: peptidase domain-containing ABC transporter [Cyanobacteria bacterium P01_A01_bin.45]